MTEQPPVPPVVPVVPVVPKDNLWRRTTSTSRGRWGLAIGAGVLAALMLLGFGVAGLAALRIHDRVSFMGDRGDGPGGYSRDRDGRGFGRGPDADDRDQRRMPGMQGRPGGREQGPGGLPDFPGGTALHGSVTARIGGSVQALVFQRGEAIALSATSIRLKSSDGFTGTYPITSATTTRGAAAVKGGQAFVLARASDKVAIAVTAGKTSRR